MASPGAHLAPSGLIAGRLRVFGSGRLARPLLQAGRLPVPLLPPRPGPVRRDPAAALGQLELRLTTKSPPGLFTHHIISYMWFSTLNYDGDKEEAADTMYLKCIHE